MSWVYGLVEIHTSIREKTNGKPVVQREKSLTLCEIYFHGKKPWGIVPLDNASLRSDHEMVLRDVASQLTNGVMFTFKDNKVRIIRKKKR